MVNKDCAARSAYRLQALNLFTFIANTETTFFEFWAFRSTRESFFLCFYCFYRLTCDFSAQGACAMRAKKKIWFCCLREKERRELSTESFVLLIAPDKIRSHCTTLLDLRCLTHSLSLSQTENEVWCNFFVLQLLFESDADEISSDARIFLLFLSVVSSTPRELVVDFKRLVVLLISKNNLHRKFRVLDGDFVPWLAFPDLDSAVLLRLQVSTKCSKTLWSLINKCPSDTKTSRHNKKLSWHLKLATKSKGKTESFNKKLRASS